MKHLPALPKPLIDFVFRYRMLIGLMVGVLLLGYVAMRINALSGVEHDQAKYDEAMSTVRSFSFDADTIKKIQQLQDPNIVVQPSIPGNRTNPF